MGRSGGTCHFCKNATENLAHLFYHCPLVNETLLFIKHKINLNVAETNYEEIYFDLKTMYFGLENQNKRISTICKCNFTYSQMGIMENKKPGEI